MLHKSSAWPLALLYAALIVFASLYPFAGWRDQELVWWAVFTQPLPPQYWTGFDVGSNIAGYLPLGFLLGLGMVRSGWPRGAVLLALGVGSALSLGMEVLQLYLPRRVPSNLDWLLNSAGAALGGGLAWLLHWAGGVQRWADFRQRWLGQGDAGGIALLLLWPWALLFPAAIPLGLGQVLPHLEAGLAQWLQGSAFSAWLPLRSAPEQALTPLGYLFCVAVGALIPCLLMNLLVKSSVKRAVAAPFFITIGVGVTALSCALGYGPDNAWAWLSRPAALGLVVGLGLAVLLAVLPWRWSAVVALLGLALQLSLLNQAPQSAYFAQTLQLWEQGRFVQFYGLGQWLGWLWPYALLVYVAARLTRRSEPL